MRLILSCALGLMTVSLPQSASQGPGVRNAHAMVFDARRGETVLFGGADASAVRGDTWLWHAHEWRDLAIVGPEPRTFPGFAWDATRHEAVLFGGRRVLFGPDKATNTVLSDTWVLRDYTWQRRQVSNAPPPRAEASMAFDAGRGVTVLFGGYTDVQQRTRLGDTWEWDGQAWSLRAQTGPDPRNGAALAYDPTQRRVVLFGGSGGPRDDTWTWDGQQWRRVATPPTPGRYNSLAAYDSRRKRIIRTTGWDGSGRVRETWLFETPMWRLVSSAGPSPRNHSAIAFDERSGRLVLHGGHDGELVFGDTWEWDGRRWSLRQAVEPQRRVDNGH